MLFRGETTDAEPKSRTRSAVRRICLRTLYSRCSRLLYIGERSRRHFEQLGCARDRLVFSPYCIDTAPFDASEEARARLRTACRETLGVNADDLLVLFSGKLTAHKRPDLLVQALRRLQGHLPQRLVALLLGDGELRGALEAAADRGSEIRVIFAGFKNQTQLSPYYHAADLLALPSSSETWGIVVHEALCHGLPCVVSDAVGCAADLIKPGQTGEVFEVESGQAFEGALTRAMALVGRAEVRAACRRLADLYSVDCAADGIARAYQSAIDASTC